MYFPSFRVLELVKVRIFPIKDFWLFIIGILLISLTSAAMGTFVSGIKPSEFFLGEEEDVLVISDPKVSTPMTGNVPLSLKNDIKRITGVDTVSAEILGVTVAKNMNDKTIIIRGITADFFNITHPVALQGNWFDQLFEGGVNSSKTFVAVAGKTLAQETGLTIGSKLVLVSTITPMTLEIIVEGIVTTGTPIDTELILPLSTAQAMVGRTAGYVSLIRVKANPSIISKTQLSNILNSEYQVSVKVQSRDLTHEGGLSGEPVLVYSSTGVLVAEQKLDSDDSATFKLPFGTYRIVAVPSFTEQSEPVEVFMNQSIMTPINLWIGKPNHELLINVSYNNRPALNATVIVTDVFQKNRGYEGATSSTGVIKFSNLTESYYRVRVSYRGLNKTHQFNLNESRELRVKIANFLQLRIYNATNGGEIKGGRIQLLNTSNPSDVLFPKNSTSDKTVLPYNSGDILQVENPGIYLVNFSLGNRHRIWNQSILGSTSKEIHFGKAKLGVTVFGFFDELLAGSNVSVSFKNEIIDNNITNEDGKIIFELETGELYEIKAINPINSSTTSSTIIFDRQKDINLRFMYWINIVTYNGTAEDYRFSRLANCNIVLYNNVTILDELSSDINGTVRITVDQPGIYYLNASYLSYHWHKSININRSDENTNIKIPLGKVKVKIKTKTSINLPIAGVIISISDENGVIENITTNNQGEAIVIIPLGNFTLTFLKMKFSRTISFSFSESQVYQLESVFDLTGTLIIRIISSGGRGIAGATVTAKNVLYNNTVVGVTNQQAEIAYSVLLWGNYSISVLIQDTTEQEFLIGFAEEKLTVILEVSIPQGLLIDTMSSLQWRGRANVAVVESAQYSLSLFSTTLGFVEITLFALMIVITALSLLSISSIISHPVTSNYANLRMIRSLGGSTKQLYFIVEVQLIGIGLISSIMGAGIGMVIMTQLPIFQLVSIGGLIITPTVNFELILAISITISSVVYMKTKQTVQDFLEISEPFAVIPRQSTLFPHEVPYITVSLKRSELRYSIIFLSLLFFSVTLILSLIRMFLIDWSDPSHDIHVYAQAASQIETLLRDFSQENFEIALKGPITRRILFNFLLAFLKSFFQIEYIVSAFMISFLSGIASLWLLKKVSSLIVFDNETDKSSRNYYPLLVVIAFSTTPIFIRSLLLPATDMFAFFLLLLSLWFFLNYINKNNSYFFIMSIIFGVIGALIREVILIVFLAYLLYPTSKKKKIFQLLFLGIPTLFLLLYSFNIDSTIFNFIMDGMGLPNINNSFDTWLSSTTEILLVRLTDLSLTIPFIISLAPLLVVIFFVSYRFVKRSSLDHQLLNLKILGFLVLWVLLYTILFIFLWNSTFVQRYWLLTGFILFQIALLPHFEIQKKNKTPISNNNQIYLFKHFNMFIFFILISYNLSYEIFSLIPLILA